MTGEEMAIWKRFVGGEAVSRIDKAMKLPSGTARKVVVAIWRKDREAYMKEVRGADYHGRTGWKYE